MLKMACRRCHQTCVQDGTDVENLLHCWNYENVWGNSDGAINVQGLQELYFVCHSPGCVWITFPLCIYCCVHCTCLCVFFAQLIVVLLLVGDSVYLHTLGWGTETKPWCVLWFLFPSASSATQVHRVHSSEYDQCTHHVEFLHSTIYVLFQWLYAGSKWFKNLRIYSKGIITPKTILVWGLLLERFFID